MAAGRYAVYTWLVGSPAQMPEGETALVGELILVADDGQENREFIVDYVLNPNGYRAIVAKDGREALDLIAEHAPDLVLLDYQMPRMTGVDVLRAMQANNWNIPVILMTFYGSEEVAVEVYRLGVRDYVKKPFSIDEMLGAIERSLSEVRLRKERDALTERLVSSNRELQLRMQEFRILYGVGRTITSLADSANLLPNLVGSALDLTGAGEGYLHLLRRGRLVCQAQKRPGQGSPEACDYESADELAQRVLDSGQAEVLTDAPDSPSYAYVPLVLRDEMIGVLGVRAERGLPLSRHHTALLTSLANYAVIAIENVRLVEEFREETEGDRNRVQTLFQRFVPPQVVDLVLNDPAGLQLGGRRRDVTVLFTDIRGYTAYAEQMPPERVVEMLNDYLSLAANVIMSYGGTLDKYIGDGLMAIFNAPEDQPQHVRAALEAAITLQQGAAELGLQRGDGLTFGVGIHTGEAIVGFIGTDCAINYTAIGDVVNVAKRLQEAARPGQILIEEAIVSLSAGRIQTQPLGELKMKGRQNNAQVYALQGLG
ncbi:MAG: response regulator [Anaerolineae bacterium]|nr:response regulator [Anaerolineae bacterium]